MNVFRTLILLISFFYVCELSAQLKKGTIQIGADAITNLDVSDGFSLKNWRVMPEASYFLFDNVSFGISGQYRNIRGLFSDWTQKIYDVGLLSRYYFYQRGRFALNLENYLGGGERISTADSGDELARTSVFRLGFGAGMTYQVIPNAALSFSYRLNREKLTSVDLNDFSSGFRFGLRININNRSKE
ncbi:MAG: outer membrane beta-barrel protein [Bacteroidia bacterium]|nr:outer membrane beta-barrel protein [Bacteroidia bacterium]